MTLLHKSNWLSISNSADRKTVEIDITGVIGSSGSSWWDDSPDQDTNNTKEKMRAELKALAEVKADLIIVNIDSPGGSVAHGLSIHDLLAQNPAKKETRVIGMTASIATVIMQVGNVRKISDNALILVHRASMGLMGGYNQADLSAVADQLKVVDAKIINIYEKRSGKSCDELTALLDSNNGSGKWMDSKEAVANGLVDEIFEPTKAVAYDADLFNKFNYPVIPQNLINIMTKPATDARSFFTKLSAAFTSAFKDSATTNEAKEINDKLTEFGTLLTAAEAENTRLETALTAKQTVIDSAIAAHTTAISDLNAAHKTALEAKDTEILKLQAKSTKTPGVVAKENIDTVNTPVSEEAKMLNADLKKLRGELTGIRVE